MAGIAKFELTQQGFLTFDYFFYSIDDTEKSQRKKQSKKNPGEYM